MVAKLRDENRMDWGCLVAKPEKQRGYEVSPITARQAYEYAHRRVIRKAAGIGTAFRPRHGKEKFDHFNRLLAEGVTNGAKLARLVGVSRNTANHWKKKV